jgi:hypothetical protein
MKTILKSFFFIILIPVIASALTYDQDHDCDVDGTDLAVIATGAGDPIEILPFVSEFGGTCLNQVTPIAHTDVVPYQHVTYGSSFNFGVVAFSKPGIKNVSFVIASGTATYNGSSPLISSSMVLNTRVASAEYPGVWEYYITISASDFSGNGTFTVTPTVTDNDGNTRVLDAVTMIVEGDNAYTHNYAYVNSSTGIDATGQANSSTLKFQTIQAAVTAAQIANGDDSSGNIIYLDEGTYSTSTLSGNTSGEWLTITKSSGSNRDNVIINEGRPRISNVKFDSITLESQGEGQEIIADSKKFYWTNSCRLIGSGRSIHRSNPVLLSSYSTDDYTFDVDQAYYTTTLIRGAIVEKIEKDAFQNYKVVINAKVTNQTNGGTYFHSDVLQTYQNDATMIPVSNRLAYNIYATDIHYQGIMRSSLYQTPHDNAYINVFIEMRDPGELGAASSTYRQLSAATGPDYNENHLLVWHCSFPYASSTWDITAENSSFIGNLFWQDRSSGTPSTTTDWLYNHFMHVYGVTPPCSNTSKGIDLGYSCPWVSASIKDTGSSTASYGDGVVDISSPGAADFGYPVDGSVLIDRLPSTYVPVDALGNVRDSSPDIGALEYP